MRIVFAGTPEFAVPPLKTLLCSAYELVGVYTQPDRPAGRGRKLQLSPVKQLAVCASLPVFQPLNFKQIEDVERLHALQPDLLVVVAYGLILPQTVLDIPKLGCINIHASLLPRWRGAAPIQRALMAGDSETGVTIMRIVHKLDAGDMLHKECCPILPTDTSADLHDRLAELGATGMTKVLPLLERGGVIAQPQDESLVTYAEKLSKAEAVIDWSKPAGLLDRVVRGLNPWPVAQTQFQGEPLRIWRAQAVEGVHEQAPGTVNPNGKYMDVATGEGFLRLLEVQLPGGKRLSSQDFMNAHRLSSVRLG
jgi:methionyl-tRNA formyltransferase